jgi:hypothetical protein
MALKLGNRTVCESKALYGKAEGHSSKMGLSGGEATTGHAASVTQGTGDVYEGIVGMTSCDQPVKISKGDLFIVEATIEIEKHPP